MPLTPFSGIRNSPQGATSVNFGDPKQSPVGKLAGDLGAMWNRGIDPMQANAQLQAGIDQQKAVAEQSGIGWNPLTNSPMGGYGQRNISTNIPAMRQQLLSRAQY
jgi:hypothetical protein